MMVFVYKFELIELGKPVALRMLIVFRPSSEVVREGRILKKIRYRENKIEKDFQSSVKI